MNNENKMYARQAFKCSICGKEYENAIDRARCELNCYAKQQEEVKKAAETEKKAAQAARKKAVDDAINKAVQLKNAYMKDYGCYTYKNHDAHSDLDDCLTLKDFLKFWM